MKVRYRFLDYVRGFAILSVVLGHLFAVVASADPMVHLDGAIRFLSVFELSLFFLISGFLLAEKAEEEFSVLQYMKKRIRRLLPVYLVFSLLYLIQEVSWFHALSIVTGYGISVLWFLPALFLSEALFLLIRKIPGKLFWVPVSAAAAVLACLCGRLAQGTGGNVCEDSLLLQILLFLAVTALRAMVGQGFVSIGYLLNQAVKKWKGKGLWVLCGASFAVGIFCAGWVKLADWRAMNLQQPLWWLAAAGAMSTAIFLLFFMAEKASLKLRLLEEIGRESLLIMCTHLQFGILPRCIALGYQMSALCTHAKSYVFWLTATASLAAVETLLILVKRYGYKY